MTKQQAKLLKIINDFIAENGYSPSYNDLMDPMGVKARSGIHRMVHGLAAAGKITLNPGRARSIEVVGPTNALIKIRMVLDQYYISRLSYEDALDQIDLILIGDGV